MCVVSHRPCSCRMEDDRAKPNCSTMGRPVSALLLASALLFSATFFLKEFPSSGLRRLSTQGTEEAPGENTFWLFFFAEWLAASEVDVSPENNFTDVIMDPMNATQWSASSLAWIEEYVADADHQAHLVRRNGKGCWDDEPSHGKTKPAVRGAREARETTVSANSSLDVSISCAFNILAAVVGDEREGKAIAKTLNHFEALVEACGNSTDVECPSMSLDERHEVEDAWWLAMFWAWWIEERSSAAGEGLVSSLRWGRGRRRWRRHRRRWRRWR
eukprot:TRINITY_DN12754_c0_g1_i1.p1 TRINITY_DN12754_c0_g1~~TRINITY_DN12754_c0_g1_i1.p1  ORF type:complete len:273 (+),score=43.45 TRINITY_DN12754_c0_g1_i1:97-915(+)